MQRKNRSKEKKKGGEREEEKDLLHHTAIIIRKWMKIYSKAQLSGGTVTFLI